MEERRNKHGKLIEDKARWSSFRAFWLGLDQNAKRRMSREKKDAILKVVVKHFFIEKEVTSTLVMDSLYSGLKALEGQTKCNKGRAKLFDNEEMPAPIVLVEKDTFLLVDDILLLLERASKEPLPPKDEKGPQNRTKDGSTGEEINKDSTERDERRLTELGRRTVEIFILAHIFSNKIEVAYQEAVALRRQEELIREEEAAWQAESELKVRRGALEKEKKTKKKQAKQKRNNRKGKDKARDERPDVAVQDKHQLGNSGEEEKDSMLEELETVVMKPDVLEDVSDLSDSVDGVGEVLQPDLEDRDASPINWDTDTSEVHPPTEASSTGISGLSSIQNGISDKRYPCPMDDSSSTCSTDSVPSVVMNGSYRGNPSPSLKNQKSPSRGKNRRKAASDRNSWENEMDNRHSGTAVVLGDIGDSPGRGKLGEPEMEVSDLSLQDRMKWPEQSVVKKDVVPSPQKQLSDKYQVGMERPSKEKTQIVASSPGSPPKSLPITTVQPKIESQSTATLDSASVRKPTLYGVQQIDRAAPVGTSSFQITGVSKPETPRVTTSKTTGKGMAQQVSVMSRPSSAPLVPGPRATAPVVSVVRKSPLLSRSMSAAGRLGPDPSTATHSYVPQSYRNAIMGNLVTSSVAGHTNSNTNSPSSGVNPSPAYSQSPPMVSAPMFLPHSSERMEPNTMKSGFPFGMVTRNGVHNGSQWMDSSQMEVSNCMNYDPSTLVNNVRNLDLYNTLPVGSRDHLNSEYPTCSSGRQTQGLSASDEFFPHLDIINELLDDEHGIGKEARVSSVFQSLSNGPSLLNGQQQFSYPSDLDSANNIGSSSSCRYDRTKSYPDDALQRSYSYSGGQYQLLREYGPQSNQLAFVNGQIDGLIPNHWQMVNSDLSLLGMRSVECDGYPYYSPDYSNMAGGVNGYTVFRPSNGH